MSETSKKIGDFQGLCENLPEGIMNVIFHVIEWVLNGFSSKKTMVLVFYTRCMAFSQQNRDLMGTHRDFSIETKGGIRNTPIFWVSIPL